MLLNIFAKLFLFIITFSVFVNCKGILLQTNTGKKWVIVKKANLRTDPLTLASIVKIVEFNTPLEVLEKTSKFIHIGSHKDYWYKVRLRNGIIGWIYGASLDNKPPKLKEETKANEDTKKSAQIK